ncbi:hypothetical protein TSUD_373560 [Trifolium subterraneum]|uniref:Uncharacterized protein n=1 Tax=Trifolium subterraneum TaxID=3900 RepID=A0A2Z6MQQ6_TRISU|nr:hypothetical protein TSUD_373560 [Trifolium subterraneum]
MGGDQDAVVPFMSIDASFQHTVGVTGFGCSLKRRDGTFVQALTKNSARLTVLGGPTVACSTTKAVEWDASWSKNFDPSGRAALGVHDLAYENQNNIVNKPVEFEKIIPLEAASVEVSIQG